MELDSSGNQIARNVYGTNLISRTVGGDTLLYLYNGHADVTALLDNLGNVVVQYYYDAFGVPLETTGSENNPFRYAGYVYDSETELYYLNARYYDPITARFLTEDTYRGKANDPLSLNLYSYVFNNPLKYYDPTGHWAADGSDERFKDSNPIVYESIGNLSDTWTNLDTLERQGVDIGNMKADVEALCNEVRRIGDSTTVTTKSITFLWKTADVNATEAVIYASNTNKGWDMLVAGNTAIDTTSKNFENWGDGTPANGFQHAFWNALGTKNTGDSNYVKYYTDAHEFGNSKNIIRSNFPNVFDYTSMDIFNNGVGRYQASLNPNASENELKQIIFDRLKVGGLKWVVEANSEAKYLN